MKLKTIDPQTIEQRTIMKLLLYYAAAEKRDLYEVVCCARKRSNLLAVYDQGHLLGCLLLDSHKEYLSACCLLKEPIIADEDCKGAIEKALKSRYPEHKMFLAVKAYPIS